MERKGYMKGLYVKFLSHPLRTNIISLFLVFSAVTILIQFAYSISLYSFQRNKTEETGRNLKYQANVELNQLVDSIVRVGETIAENETIQLFLKEQQTPAGENLLQRRYMRSIIINYIYSIARANSFITDIAIVTENEEITSCNGYFDYVAYTSLNRNGAFADEKEGGFTTLVKEVPGQYGHEGYFYNLPVYQTWGIYNSSPQYLGRIVIWCSAEPLKELAGNSVITENSIAAITDAKGRILELCPGWTKEEVQEMFFDILQEKNKLYQNEIQIKRLRSKKSYLMTGSNQPAGWYIVIITPIDEINTAAKRSLYEGIGISVLTIGVALAVMLLVVRSIMKPLTAIITAIRKLNYGDRSIAAEKVRIKEFDIIVNSINEMLSNLHDLNRKALNVQEKLYRTELMQKETDLLAFQSKIDPHFLNNTLECIRSIARIRGVKEISVITTSMAGIFQFSTTDTIFTTVREEFACIKDYEKIMSIRYRGRVQIAVDVEEELLSYAMLKMSLQPLVENAVYHGRSDDVLVIRIIGVLEGEFEDFTVTDNGIGMNAGRLSEVRQLLLEAEEDYAEYAAKISRHIGLSNIHARICLHYGKGCGLDIDSREGMGTSIHMRIRRNTIEDTYRLAKEAEGLEKV